MLALGKLQIRLVGLRLHFPAENRRICTESRTNAKASAFATVLQKDEALLRLFGPMRYFPIVGKWRIGHSFWWFSSEKGSEGAQSFPEGKD